MKKNTWFVSYGDRLPHFVVGLYPPEYGGDLPTKNCLEVTQNERDLLWESMQHNPMCYDPTTGAFKPYVPLPPTLEQLKEQKINELDNDFITRTHGSITTTHGYLMQFDTTDSLKMQGAVSLMEATGATEGYLTQADDTTVYNVPLDVMKAVLIEMMSAFAACHARKQELRAAINAAQSKEDLDTIEIAWPV